MAAYRGVAVESARSATGDDGFVVFCAKDAIDLRDRHAAGAPSSEVFAERRCQRGTMLDGKRILVVDVERGAGGCWLRWLKTNVDEMVAHSQTSLLDIAEISLVIGGTAAATGDEQERE